MTKGHKRLLIAAGFIALFMIEASVIAVKKSNTWDEPAHILSGYAHITDGMDYISPLNHPAFGRMLTGVLPALFLNLDFDNKVMPEQAKDSGFFPYSVKFLYGNNVKGGLILFLSRLPNILIGALLGIYIFLWSEELWGLRGGYLSLFLYSLSPTILSNASLATTDMPIAAFFFISSYYLFRLAKDGPNAKGIAIAAILTALAFASKHTAFLLLSVVAIAMAEGFRKGPFIRTALYYFSFALIIYALIWAIYGFRFHSASPSYSPLYWDRFASSGFMPLFDFLRGIKFLPEAYLYSVAGVLMGAGSGKAAFLMGRYSVEGWWYYFPVAFLIKTPIPVIIFLIASLLFIPKKSGLKEVFLYIIFPAALVFIIMSMQKVNIGIRHILPVYPFIFTLIGFAPNIRTQSRRLAAAVFYGCVIWYIYSAASIFPHDLAYFNEFIGGPKNGYKYLVDSNLDWGQDLAGVKEYMDEKKIDKIKLAYFGLSDPGYFHIDYDYLPSFIIIDPQNVNAEVPLKGYFAVSATMLQGVYLPDRDFYKIFRDSQPIDTIGYSIFIYRF